MWLGTGSGGKKDPQDAVLNLGGPSMFTMQKNSSGYTTKSGVIKPWLLAFQKMCSLGDQTFVKNDTVSVTAVCLANDSTALKASIAFDERQGLNIGLINEVDTSFVNANPNPSPSYLRENVVTEANVTCLTTADNQTSMPVAVTYMTKRGKTGDYVKKQILQEVKIIQTCLACVRDSKSRNSTISEEDVSHCQAGCEVCVEAKVCEGCALQGHESPLPALRACSKCIKFGKKCIKLVVLVVAADCEMGNKSAFEQIINDRESGAFHIGNYLFSVLPDPVHVGKSLKASYANWPILLSGQRSCLTQLQTLHKTKSEFKRLIPSSAVTNKDRMDVSALVHLTKQSVLTFLSGIGSIIHSIVPDAHKLSDSNRHGLYPHPIAISCSEDGKLYALDYLPLKGVTKLLHIRQHVPADVTVLGEYGDCRCLHVDSKGTVYICEHDKAIKVWPKQAANLQTQQLRRAQLLEELDKRSLSKVGTVPTLRARLKDDLLRTRKDYENKGVQMDEVHFQSKLSPSCICGDSLHASGIVIASDEAKCFYTVEISSNGVTFQGTPQLFSEYPEGVQRIKSMVCHENVLFFVHEAGLGKVDFVTKLSSLVLANNTNECHTCEAVTSSTEGLVFCDSGAHKVQLLNNVGEVLTLAGSGQEGNKDGSAGEAQFSQLKDVTMDQDTLFVCDSQAGAIKMLTRLNGTVTYLKNLGMFYDAFSIHLKHKSPKTKKTLQQCIDQVKAVQTYLESTVSTRQAQLNTARQLNGPEGAVSARTIKSVNMIYTELTQLQQTINDTAHGNFQMDVQSLLTLCVENIHAIGHFKQQFPTMLEHARNLSNTVRESLKRIASWAAVYYTHRDSYYPVPESSISIRDIPKMDVPIQKQKISQETKQKMRDWANDHGKSVRQRTVRQQTTMFSAGTLPLNMYDNTAKTSEKIFFNSNETENIEENDLENRAILTDEPSFVQEDTFDTDSCSEADESSDEESISDSENPQCLDFLVGRVSRSGRQIRFRQF